MSVNIHAESLFPGNERFQQKPVNLEESFPALYIFYIFLVLFLSYSMHLFHIVSCPNHFGDGLRSISSDSGVVLTFCQVKLYWQVLLWSARQALHKIWCENGRTAVQVLYDTFPFQSHYMWLSQVDIFVWAGLDLSKHVKYRRTEQHLCHRWVAPILVCLLGNKHDWVFIWI